MAKLPVTHKIPWKAQDIESGDHKELTDYMKSLIRALQAMHEDIARVVNLNAVEFVSQAGQPTPSEGRLMVWKDSDAATGQPTHYLVYTTRDGATVTFASKETA
jgi:hypothetical protein